MKVRRLPVAIVCALMLAASVPGAAYGQDDEAPMIIYASYFTCDASQNARAGEIIRDTWAPVAQAHIDAGDLAAWGSIVHNTGGSWSRAIYHAASDRAVLFNTLDQMVAEWGESSPEAAAEFGEACETHEDYVWTNVNGSSAPSEVVADRSGAGLSVYWECDAGRGALIDLLAETVFAPAWDAQVESGLVNSWSWHAHLIGDKYRRLFVADGADHETLLTARDNVIEWVGDNYAGLGAEFTNVCNSHVDYLWDIEMAAP
jgi:hypothetical protein